jgi:hypothetical protein
MDIIAELETINAAAAEGAEILDMALALGQFVARGSDISRAVLGALADTLTVRYNEGTLAEFAKAVGIEARTARDYRQVVRLLGFGATRRFISDGVPFKVMLHTSRYYPDDPHKAAAFVDIARLNSFSIAEADKELAAMHGKPSKPAVLVPEQDAVVYAIDYAHGRATFVLGDGISRLAEGECVTVRVVAAAVRGASGAGSEAVSEAEAGS